MATVDTLLVRIDADLSSLKTELDKAGRLVDGASHKMAASANTAQTAFAGLGKVLAGLVTIQAASRLVQFGYAALSAAADIKDLAAQIGVTTDTFQELTYAGAQFGISQEQISTSLAIFSRNIGQAANGSDSMIASLRGLGVSILDSNGALKSNDIILGDVVEAISRIPDAAKQAAVGAEFFGRGFAKLLPMFKDGKIGLEELKREARAAGGVLGGELVDKADGADDALKRLQVTLDKMVETFVAKNLAGHVKKLADNLVYLLSAPGDAAKLVKLNEEIASLENRLARPGIGSKRDKEQLAKRLAEREQMYIDAEKRAKQATGLYGDDGELRPAVTTPAKSSGGLPESDKFKALREEMDLQLRLAQVTTDLSGVIGQEIAVRDRRRAVIEAESAAVRAGFEPGSAEYQQIVNKKMAIYDLTTTEQLNIDIMKSAEEQKRRVLDADLKEQENLAKMRQAKEDVIATAEKEIETNDLLIAALKTGTKEYEQQKAEIELLNRAKKTGLGLSDEDKARIKAAAKATGAQTDEVKRLNDEYENQKRLNQDLSHVIGTAFEDAIINGGKFRDVLKGIADDIARIILRASVTKPLENMLTSAMGGGGGGGMGGGGMGGGLLGIGGAGLMKMFEGGGGGLWDSIFGGSNASPGGGSGLSSDFFSGGESDFAGQFSSSADLSQSWGSSAFDTGDAFSSGAGGLADSGGGWFSGLGDFFGGFFADGGDPPMGKASLVGENGPELFVPKKPGTIVSNNDMGKTGGTYYIDARGADRSGIEQLQKTIKELNGSIERRSVNAVMDHKRRNPAGFAA